MDVTDFATLFLWPPHCRKVYTYVAWHCQLLSPRFDSTIFLMCWTVTVAVGILNALFLFIIVCPVHCVLCVPVSSAWRLFLHRLRRLLLPWTHTVCSLFGVHLFGTVSRVAGRLSASHVSYERQMACLELGWGYVVHAKKELERAPAYPVTRHAHHRYAAC